MNNQPSSLNNNLSDLDNLSKDIAQLNKADFLRTNENIEAINDSTTLTSLNYTQDLLELNIGLTSQSHISQNNPSNIQLAVPLQAQPSTILSLIPQNNSIVNIEDQLNIKQANVEEPNNKSMLSTIKDYLTKEPTLKYVCNTGKNYCIAQASVGLSHLNGKIQTPCQDSVKASLTPRPVLIACDGAGSSTMSDIGSNTICIQLTRFCKSIEPILGDWLDVETPVQDYTLLVKMIYRQTTGILKDLSEEYRRDVKDFRSTLNFAIIGEYHTLWLKVGDGEIIKQTIQYYDDKPNEFIHKLECIGEQVKGEFANQTQFVDEHLKFEDIQWGILKRSEVQGLAIMSDGASEKLVSNNRDKISGQINQWLDSLREQKLKAGDIAKRFYSEEFNHRSAGDDRSIVLWAEQFSS